MHTETETNPADPFDLNLSFSLDFFSTTGSILCFKIKSYVSDPRVCWERYVPFPALLRGQSDCNSVICDFPLLTVSIKPRVVHPVSTQLCSI